MAMTLETQEQADKTAETTVHKLILSLLACFSFTYGYLLVTC